MPADESPASHRYQEALGPLVQRLGDPRAQKKLSEVLALLDFNSTLNRSLELSEILDIVLFVAMGETRASWAGVLLHDEAALVPAARRGRSDARWDELEIPEPEGLPRIAAVGDDEVDEWAREVLTSTGAALLVPLVKSDRLVGLLLLGDRGEPYGPEERVFAGTLCISAAASIDNGRIYEELQSLNRHLSFKVYQLNSLFDITRELNRSPDVARVREVLLTNAMGHVLTTRALMIHEGAVVGAARPPSVARGARETREGERRALRSGRRLQSVRADSGRASRAPRRLGIDTVIPLKSGESCHGALLLGPRASGKSLAEEERDFLRSLASQAASALDNLRLTGSGSKSRRSRRKWRLPARFSGRSCPRAS